MLLNSGDYGETEEIRKERIKCTKRQRGGKKRWQNKCTATKDRHAGGEDVWMLHQRDEQDRDKRDVRKTSLCMCVFFFLPASIYCKGFWCDYPHSSSFLTEALFKSTVRNAPLMDSAKVSICINGLLLTPTKPSMEPCICQQWLHLVKPKTEL